jgi:XapX domain-containing protein
MEASSMKIYLLSLGAGILVGIIYGLIHVRSPAPPVIALVGLLGILVGEQVVPIGRHLIAGTSLHAAWQQSYCTQHIFGRLPGRNSARKDAASVGATPDMRS